MKALKFVLGLIISLLWLAWDVVVHIGLTAIMCFVFTLSLQMSFNVEVSWVKITILWYGVFLLLYHFKNNLQDKNVIRLKA